MRRVRLNEHTERAIYHRLVRQAERDVGLDHDPTPELHDVLRDLIKQLDCPCQILHLLRRNRVKHRDIVEMMGWLYDVKNANVAKSQFYRCKQALFQLAHDAQIP